MTEVAVALCFLVQEKDGGLAVLLGHKKSGFGTGKVVGVGGKLESGETAPEAACREVMEETGVTVRQEDLEPAGRILFDFPSQPLWNMDAALFVARRWSGEPAESEEIAPEWFGLDALPLALMWHDAGTWLPMALTGAMPNFRIVLNDDNETAGRFDPLDPLP